MNRRAIQSVRFVLLVAGSAVFVLPLLWMFSTALKPLDQTMTLPPQWLPVRWTADSLTPSHDDAQGQTVGLTSADYDRAVERGEDEVSVLVAYQWWAAVDGREVPVRVPRLEPGEDGLIEVFHQVHWESTSRGLPVRVLDEVAGRKPDEALRVYVMEPDGMQTPASVVRGDLTLVDDVTDDATDRSYSVERSARVAPDALTKREVPWDDRQRLAHVLTEPRTVPTASLTSTVDARWENFGDAIAEMRYFPRYLRNTLVLCLLTVIGTTLSSALVAYGFARIQWPGRDKVFVIVLATMMIPFPVVMVPLYSLFRWFGWIGSLKPLWVPTFFAAAFNVFLLRQFFRTIPLELSESARIDGCSEFRIFWQIVLPLAKPAVTVVALFQFLATWNDFLGPLIYLTDQRDFTLALGLQFFQAAQGGTLWNLLMAASSLIVIPVIMLFFLTQRTFIEGVSMTGLKG